jgi:hypothetical protein
MLWSFDKLCDYLQAKGVKFTVTDRYGDGHGGSLTQTQGTDVGMILIRHYDTEAEALQQKTEKPEWRVKVWGRFRLMSTRESFFREVTDLLD